MDAIQTLVDEFASRLSDVIETQIRERARTAMEGALGGGSVAARPRGGRPPKAPLLLGKKPRKKAPLQLCPVPGCKNPAAPVFGMVCAKHKGVAKSKIRKYREARKAKKAKAS